MKTNLPITQTEVKFPEGHYIVSRTDLKGTITYANETFLRLFGLGLPALMGLQLRDLDQRLAGLCAPGYPYCSKWKRRGRWRNGLYW